MDLGCKIKLLREEKNISREELANYLNLSYSSLSKYETNKRFPDKIILNKFADFFNVSTDYLLDRTNIKRFNATSDKLNNILELLNELDESKIEKIETIIKNILTLQEK